MSKQNTTPNIKRDIQTFWRSLYESLYDDVDTGLTKEKLLKSINDLQDMFEYRQHMSVVEMPLNDLRGKSVLEIGSGAGGHSALFAKYGAVMMSVDITFERAASTATKFKLLGSDAVGCKALQADAEELPFADNTFDIVYSNGVLHHTSDTGNAIGEVCRVLKPSGDAVIMLYCKSSWHYWFDMLFCVGILQAKLLGGENWLGRATEWGGRNKQTVENPITRCYTNLEIMELFSSFETVTMRKGGFYFRLIPKIGKIILRRQIKRFGLHPGGRLVYGASWPVQSPLELKLGRFIGWAWFIKAKKNIAKGAN